MHAIWWRMEPFISKHVMTWFHAKVEHATSDAKPVLAAMIFL